MAMTTFGRVVNCVLTNTVTKQPLNAANLFAFAKESFGIRYASSFKHRDRKDLLKTVSKPDEGTFGEHTISVDAVIHKKEDMFTDERTPNLLFNGVIFTKIPICKIRSTKNNTHVTLSDGSGKSVAYRTAGLEGFKNSRKGTNVAGQAAALAVAKRAVAIGIKDVRVLISGLGPGRMSSIKGLELGGMNIISITDDTPVSFSIRLLRPRKQRRL